MPIRITVNGSGLELSSRTSIADFIASKGLANRRIAVAYNGDVIPEEKFCDVIIDEDDVLEIVRPVGGG